MVTALLAMGVFGVSGFDAGTAQNQEVLTRIGLGSCLNQDRPQEIWPALLASKPQAFIWMGDNMYASREGSRDRGEQYGKLGGREEFQALKRSARFFVTWDDHDYGKNDAGADWEEKGESKKDFMEFWGDAIGDGVKTREGIYDSAIVGPEGKRVQIILLDTRSFRSSITRIRKEEGMTYVKDFDRDKTMLGEAQWNWLEGELKKPAELRLVVSSIQVVAEDHRFEKWANFPLERKKMFDLVKSTGAEGVVFLSGDRHLAEISMTDAGVGYPMYDLTSSALNSSSTGFRYQEENRWRVGSMNFGHNFGMIEVDWEREDPLVDLQIRDVEGDVVLRQKLMLSWLKPRD